MGFRNITVEVDYVNVINTLKSSIL